MSLPFALRPWLSGSLGALAPIAPLAERAFGLAALNRRYQELPGDGRPFVEKALESLNVRYEVDEQALARVPPSGPLIVVANHPFGALDGLILVSLLRRVRPDVKLLGNFLLECIPDLRDAIVCVDPFRKRSTASRSTSGLRQALQWLESGGTLGVFPAGEVAHETGSDGQVTDSPWSTDVARLAHRTGATVLPVHFAGANSWLFRLVGRVHPLLRTALLPRELLRRQHETMAVRLGSPIPWSRLERMENAAQRTAYLRLRTFALAGRGEEGSADESGTGHSSPIVAIAPPQPTQRLREEIDALPAPSVLLRSGAFTVCLGQAAELPATLLEIGRLREETFRAAGEGTGLSCDLDRFDRYYRHLFVWNHERHEIVGAYRMALTDEILPADGAAGLYTNTLFHYDRALLSEIEPALELGRAFVRREYQRDYSPLMLLWRGIGTFVARNPRYRMLFGPVSISNDYHSLSRQLLARFLYTTSYHRDLARLVRAKNPPSFLRSRRGSPPVFSTIVRNVTEVGALLAEIERDQKGVPILLRQYLRLNAKLLGFNLDPAFGNALDGLMLVDLTEVDRSLLLRYMGAEGAEAFLSHHGVRARYSELQVG